VSLALITIKLFTGGPFGWSAWRDAPQPSPPALMASQPFSSFGQPSQTSPQKFVFGKLCHLGFYVVRGMHCREALTSPNEQPTNESYKRFKL